MKTSPLNIVKIAFISLILLTSCDQKISPQEKIKVKAEIKLAFKDLIDAANSLDFDRYLSHIDEELFTGLRGDGTVMHSRAILEQSYRAGFAAAAKIESLEFQNVKITVLDKTTAILVNEFQETILLKSGQIHTGAGGGTQVWHKTAGTWKLVSLSSSAAP